MDWKDDLGAYFAKKGVLRLKHLNNNLENYCKEWVTYLLEFEGVSASSSNATVDRNDRPLKCTHIITKNKTIDFIYPFQVYIAYCQSQNASRSCLYIKWTVKLAGMKAILATKADEEDGNFIWEEEEFIDPEIIEKEYVFQLLNNRLKKFYDRERSIGDEETD